MRKYRTKMAIICNPKPKTQSLRAVSEDLAPNCKAQELRNKYGLSGEASRFQVQGAALGCKAT